MNQLLKEQSESSCETRAHNYDLLASTYDISVAVFTGGQNLTTRLSQIPELTPGERVAYVGVGSAEDAIEAARKGVHVTCIDLSSAMLKRARRRFDSAQVSAEFVNADIMDYEPERPFDAVVANFFLNIFPRPVMEQVLTRLVSLVRPGGKFLIADFAAPRGNALLRLVHLVYYRIGLRFYWILGLCRFHPVYIYADYYPQLGLTVKSTRHYRMFLIGPWLFQTTLAIKDST